VLPRLIAWPMGGPDELSGRAVMHPHCSVFECRPPLRL
jgi:hypothetical protein